MNEWHSIIIIVYIENNIIFFSILGVMSILYEWLYNGCIRGCRSQDHSIFPM